MVLQRPCALTVKRSKWYTVNSQCIGCEINQIRLSGVSYKEWGGEINTQLCTGCGCAQICPRQAITISEESKVIPVVDTVGTKTFSLLA